MPQRIMLYIYVHLCICRYLYPAHLLSRRRWSGNTRRPRRSVSLVSPSLCVWMYVYVSQGYQTRAGCGAALLATEADYTVSSYPLVLFFPLLAARSVIHVRRSVSMFRMSRTLRLSVSVHLISPGGCICFISRVAWMTPHTAFFIYVRIIVAMCLLFSCHVVRVMLVRLIPYDRQDTRSARWLRMSWKTK